MHRTIALMAVCFMALGGGCAIAWYLYELETKAIEVSFQRSIVQRANQLDNELDKLRATLNYWRVFYETSGNPPETEQFRSIAKGVLKTYTSLQVIGWAPTVPRKYRAAFEKPFKRANPNFSIFTLRPEMNKADVNIKDVSSSTAFDPRLYFEPSGEKNLYFPLAVLEPQERVGFLTGIDTSSLNSVAVSKYVERAQKSADGNIAALPALPSPFSPKHEPIFVALVPVYLDESKVNKAHSDALQGFITAVFSIEQLVSISSMADLPKGISLQLVDMTGDGGMKLLYRHGEKIQRRMVFERPIVNVLGRRWVMVASPSDAYIAAQRTFLPYLVVIGAVSFTCLFLMYSVLTRQQTAKVQAQVASKTRELRYANEKLEKLARTDSLTEVANRRFFNETLQCEWRRASRDGLSLTIMLVDIDYFKRFNDCYGHLQGDECLQLVARTLEKAVRRGGDLVARYGGEEFALILPNVGKEAMQLAERCRAAVLALEIPHEESETSEHVTISIGMSSTIPDHTVAPEDLLDSADRGLYSAKDSGRNTAVFQKCQPRRRGAGADRAPSI